MKRVFCAMDIARWIPDQVRDDGEDGWRLRNPKTLQLRMERVFVLGKANIHRGQ